jgi:hypothetical protein
MKHFFCFYKYFEILMENVPIVDQSTLDAFLAELWTFPTSTSTTGHEQFWEYQDYERSEYADEVQVDLAMTNNLKFTCFP